MQNMDVSGSIPEVVRDRMPTESSNTRKYIDFTKFVLEKISEIKPGQVVKKRSVKKVKEEGLADKIDPSQLLALANKACLLNKSKIFQGQPFAPSLETDAYQDLTNAEFILRDQLKTLVAKDGAEALQAMATGTPDISQKRKTPTPVPKTIEEDAEKKVQGPKPQKVQKKELISPVKKETRELEKVVREMDQTLRSLGPFTVEGLMDKERKAGGIREENVKIEVVRSLHRANEIIASFCAAYFHATALANQTDPSQGEELRKLLAEVDKRFGKLPVVEAYMKGLQKYVEEEKQKKEKVLQKQAPQAQGIHTMKEIERGIGKDTQALIEEQEKILTAQKEAALATRSDLASGRAVQYFGLYGQLAASSISTMSRVGASVGETVDKDAGKVVGAALGASYGSKLISHTGDAVATTALTTQMPLWDKEDWIIGATTYLLSFGLTFLAQAHGIPASPWTVAAIATTLATGPLGKRIIKPIIQGATTAIKSLFKVEDVGKKTFKAFSGSSSTSGVDPQFYIPLLESARLFAGQTGESSSSSSSSLEAPPEKKRK